MKRLKVFGLSQSTELANDIAKHLGLEQGAMHLTTFKDKEIEPVFDEHIRDHNVFIVGSTHNSDAIVEMLLALDAARSCGAKKINVVMPFYGYARQDRRSSNRDGIGARALALAYQAVGLKRIIIADLHATQTESAFKREVINLPGRDIFLVDEEIKALFAAHDNWKIATPDHGGYARAEKFAKALKLGQVVQINKHRDQPNKIGWMELVSDESEVIGKRIMLIDDMGDTCGTIAKAAALLMEKGALEVYAIVTHPVFSDNAYEIVGNSQIKTLFVANTLPVPAEKNGFKLPNNIKVINSKTIFANVIQAIHEKRSTRIFKNE